MKYHSNRQRKGFTLIELLVVIAIISILAAILFPVFAQAKEAAKKTVCLAQVKEVSLATVMYQNDYDDYYPMNSYFDYVPGVAATAYFWWGGFAYGLPGFTGPTYSSNLGFLYPYMKNQPIYGCPTSQSQLESLNPGEAYLYPLGYGTNFNLFATNPPTVTPVVSGSTVASAAETVLVADCGGIYTQAGGTFAISEGSTLGYNVFQANYVDGPEPETGYFAGPFNNPTTWGVHGAGISNVGWADGHAKGMKPTIRPLASEYLVEGSYNSPALSLEVAQYYHIGDIMNPKYPYGSQYQDYYYMTSKP